MPTLEWYVETFRMARSQFIPSSLTQCFVFCSQFPYLNSLTSSVAVYVCTSRSVSVILYISGTSDELVGSTVILNYFIAFALTFNTSVGVFDFEDSVLEK